jgi:hypothetical protein
MRCGLDPVERALLRLLKAGLNKTQPARRNGRAVSAA